MFAIFAAIAVLSAPCASAQELQPITGDAHISDTAGPYCDDCGDRVGGHWNDAYQGPSWHNPVSPRAPGIPLEYATPGTAQAGVGYYGPDGIVTQQVAHDDAWQEPSPLERFFSEAASHSWVRLEYLQWDVEDPGNKLLGARLGSVINERTPFPVFDFQDPPNQIGDAIVPDTNALSMKDINGIRGTWGVDTTFGTFEANFFALDQAGDKYAVPDLHPQREIAISTPIPSVIIEPGFFAATSLLENGQPSNLVQLYNRAFVVTYENDVLGAEANLVLKTIRLGYARGLEIQPLIGGRYLLIQEQMTQTGVFAEAQQVTGTIVNNQIVIGPPVSGQILAPPLTSVIDSDTFNNIAGPTIGVRVEYQHPRFTLGVEPKITFGADAFSARVSTERLRSAADPHVITKDEGVMFSPVGELQLYARIHVTENFSLSVGYSIVEAFRITRPADNIFYNDNGPFPTPPGVVLDTDETDFQLKGLTVGGEIRFK